MTFFVMCLYAFPFISALGVATVVMELKQGDKELF